MPDPIARLNTALDGRYEIERELGEGGMATVYLADDLKHERRVALKVLKPELAAVVGADRFLAEIKTTANLTHPHILPLFDSGEADGFLYYVMPFIEGETLRERIDRDKQLPVHEAVGIAVAVSNALHAAHQAGVVHRDIKPGNILMSNGEPLVADFGIALAVGTASGTRLTETGLSVGTPYYMSPEQATGDQAIGAASDIYALAAVLYELLVGEPPYVGNTAQAVLGKILQGDPVSATTVRKSIPLNVDAALRKALEKLPADRFTDAQGFAQALLDDSFAHGNEGHGREPGTGRWAPVAVGSSAVAVLALAGLAWALNRLPEESHPSIERFEMPFRSNQLPISFAPFDFAMSADGSMLAYVGPPGQENVPQVWVRRWDDLEAQPVRGTAGPTDIDIAGDGSHVAISSGGVIRVVPVAGGPDLTLGRGRVPRFGGDGFVYWGSGGGVMRAPSGGGAAEQILSPHDDWSVQMIAQIFPGGRYGLEWAFSQSDGSPHILIADLESGESTHLVAGGLARYVQTGHLLYVVDDVLLAAPFDVEERALSGPPVPMIEQVGAFAVSDGGRLLHASGNGGGLSELAWFDRFGNASPVEPGWSFNAGESNAGWSLSPDARMIALRERTEAGLDVWIKELGGGPRSRLTFDESEDRKPVWGPEPGWVTFLSQRNGEGLDVWKRRADGTGSAELVLDLNEGIAEVSWDALGEWLVMRTVGVPGQPGERNVQARRSSREAEPIPLLMGEYDEISPSLSPDGRWLVYASSETGSYEVFVRPFPAVDSGRWQISTNGGMAPRWSRDGSEIFFLDGRNTMMSGTVETGATFQVTGRETLFELPSEVVRSDIFIPYDVGPSADRQLLMARSYSGDSTDGDSRPAMILVNNWFEELKLRAPTGGS